MTSEAFAPAKINLTLHVTGQRADGYHLLDSLVMLVTVGDRVQVRRAENSTLQITGPMAAGVPTGPQNLVLRAAQLMGVTAEITLEKHLPAAAGIGGGSSDAAACLRALARLYDVPLPDVAQMMGLGADVPVCMQPGLTRMTGTGETVEVLGPAPDWPMLLVNPRVDVPTGPVFQALASKDNAPMPTDIDMVNLIDWTAAQRNDLEPPARRIAPQIDIVLGALRSQDGCALARMSGSGATCFAVLRDGESRDDAVARLRHDHPDWWVMPAERCGDLFS